MAAPHAPAAEAAIHAPGLEGQAPGGPAGGDLGGTYPNPILKPTVPAAAGLSKQNEPHAVQGAGAKIVYLSITGKAEATEYEILVDGKRVYLNKAETLTAAAVDFTHCIIVKEGGTFEVKVLAGTLAAEPTVVEQRL